MPRFTTGTGTVPVVISSCQCQYPQYTWKGSTPGFVTGRCIGITVATWLMLVRPMGPAPSENARWDAITIEPVLRCRYNLDHAGLPTLSHVGNTPSPTNSHGSFPRVWSADQIPRSIGRHSYGLGCPPSGQCLGGYNDLGSRDGPRGIGRRQGVTQRPQH